MHLALTAQCASPCRDWALRKSSCRTVADGFCQGNSETIKSCRQKRGGDRGQDILT